MAIDLKNDLWLMLLCTSSTDALEAFAKQANEVPERIAVKYRRSLEQHEAIMANIPHAQVTSFRVQYRRLLTIFAY